MLLSTCAILPCADMDRTVAFYEKLGFDLQGRWEDFGGYLIFVNDRIELHFAHDPTHRADTSDHAVYIRTDDVNAVGEMIAKMDLPDEGFPRADGPSDRPWGMRELHILDPDGHLLRIGQYLDG
ncbi:bleomycin resistance protein [Roseobacter sinensis]|uniref:Bleomycin resistance protein n=1 Tax=Roseobacter sinensis TaxID=2931391 RepID=A0ABT3BAD2_9RHOB|nr:VOC family protein [Roseobacter sp. WL0113]MCV3270098.1 VOC family protein [Roseobacter sp. WL0113]